MNILLHSIFSFKNALNYINQHTTHCTFPDHSPIIEKEVLYVRHVKRVELVHAERLEKLLDRRHAVTARQLDAWVVRDEGQAHLLLRRVTTEGGSPPCQRLVRAVRDQIVARLYVCLVAQLPHLLVAKVVIAVVDDAFQFLALPHMPQLHLPSRHVRVHRYTNDIDSLLGEHDASTRWSADAHIPVQLLTRRNHLCVRHRDARNHHTPVIVAQVPRVMKAKARIVHHFLGLWVVVVDLQHIVFG